MVSKPTFYGVVAVLLAATLVSSSLAILYYNGSQERAASSQRYSEELSTALSKYNALKSSYGSSLNDFKTTLLLLADAVANLNTSSPSYQNASVALASLWGSYRALAEANGAAPLAYSVSIEVSFGNGTKVWYNGTAIQPGWNGYLVTLVGLSGRVQATWYPQYQQHFVTGLDGVQGSGADSWFLWEYSNGDWQLSQTGADSMRVYNGTVLAWTLCGYDVNFSPTCRP